MNNRVVGIAVMRTVIIVAGMAVPGMITAAVAVVVIVEVEVAVEY